MSLPLNPRQAPANKGERALVQLLYGKETH